MYIPYYFMDGCTKFRLNHNKLPLNIVYSLIMYVEIDMFYFLFLNFECDYKK